MEPQKLEESLGLRYMKEVKEDWESLDRKKIFNEQTNLIKEFNQNIPEIASQL